jgi:hypothetical protein
MAIATRPIHPSGWLKSSEIRSRCYLALMDLADVNAITTAVANWAIERDDIRAMAMLGSWVRGNPRPASDLDLLLLSDLAPDYQRFRTWLTEIDFQNAGFRLRSSESAIYGVISFPAAVILLHKAIPPDQWAGRWLAPVQPDQELTKAPINLSAQVQGGA